MDQLIELDDNEIAVLRLLAEGMTPGEIARELGIGTNVSNGLVRDVTVKIGARNRSHAVAMAIRSGLI